MIRVSRSATWRSTASPPACPRLSLIDLKWSMSIISTATSKS
jgi:hypothetical protein